MDPADLVPVEIITEFLKIPDSFRWLILFSILIIGYITLKYFLKFHNLKGKLSSIDEIMLIVGYGTIFSLKIIYLMIWCSAIFLIVFVTRDIFLIIFSVIILAVILIILLTCLLIDILSILDEKRTLQKDRRHIFLSLSILFTLIFSIASIFSSTFSDTYSKIIFGGFLTFSTFISMNPTIYYIVKWYRHVVT